MFSTNENIYVSFTFLTSYIFFFFSIFVRLLFFQLFSQWSGLYQVFHQRIFFCFKMKLFSVVSLIKFVIDENVW